MVKSYLRYTPGKTFGVIASPLGNLASDSTGRLAISPTLQSVTVWDTKKAEPVAVWTDDDNSHEVTCITRSPDNKSYAVGYADGSIRVWSLAPGASSSTPVHWFQGHSGAVTALTYDAPGTTLASGAKDTNIVLWDIVAGAGKARLTGHKDEVTSLVFVPSGAALSSSAAATAAASSSSSDSSKRGTRYTHLLASLPAAHLLSSSKDTTIKAWDLTTRACVETVVTHRSEVWALALTHMWQDAADVLTVVSAGEELKVHKLNATHLDQPPTRALTHVGDLKKLSTQRSTSLALSPCHNYMILGCVDTQIQVFKLLTPEEHKDRLTRRRKKARDQAAAQGVEFNKDAVTLPIASEISALFVSVAPAKVRSLAVCPVVPGGANKSVDKGGVAFAFMASLADNSVLTLHVTKDEVKQLSAVDMPGHRGDIRAVALSQDDELVATAGTAVVKVWNVRTGTCIRSLDSGYALCVAFVPGGKYLLVGTKSGELQLYSLASSSLVETIQAHDSAIWSIAVLPDKSGFITGGADKQVKFWDFALVKEEANRVTAIHTRTLKLADEVLCVCVSPNQQVVAISLLDTTVKVFYLDTLKFSLSLYGHKLPVLSMDISSDNSLIVTGSADKNIKIWGLDFGDCHRSLFAHQDSIMQVRFYECISTLQGHVGEVWALAVAKFGTFVTDEQVFLEEERQKEMAEVADQAMLEAANEQGEEGGQVALANQESLKAGERIVEALQVCVEEREKVAAYKKEGKDPSSIPLNIMLQAYGCADPESFVLQSLEKVRAADLEAALLVIPASYLPLLLELADYWAERRWSLSVTCRVLFFLLKVHHAQIAASRGLRSRLMKQRDMMGANMAAFRYLRKEKEYMSSSAF
ncbi:WD40-repeat-containing domain protein [Catenaria anguillulae PL171]|uniref:WD40-repeat-containing domain protein n=1 Tax=Catenaria anguillulae PL171 TaxID=765915 RepID=A0A1Y2HR18_9FUNG|nr:WD40-repeat-containing domain protein [Catenaria anguillulae PL171]